MSLWGPALRGAKVEPPKQGGTQAVSSGSGFMAGFRRKNLPRTLQVIGAGMRDIGGGNHLDAFTSNEAEQQRLAAAEMAQGREGKLEEQQRGYVDQAIGSLPTEQQPWARLAPEAAARSVFAQQAQPDYELDANGRPYTIQGGQVQYGQGQVAVQTPGTDRAPPAGYQWTPEGNLQAIQGGPADIRATTEGRMRLQQTDSSIRQLDNAISSLPENINNSAAGFWGGMTRSVPGSSAYDLNQTLEPVRAILSFENLQEMRRNSSTGGALGSIAVRELELLGNTVRSLDTAQSPSQLAGNIREVRRQLTRTRDALAAARAEMQQGPEEQQQQAPAEGGGRVMQWSPERGVY